MEISIMQLTLKSVNLWPPLVCLTLSNPLPSAAPDNAGLLGRAQQLYRYSYKFFIHC